MAVYTRHHKALLIQLARVVNSLSELRMSRTQVSGRPANSYTNICPLLYKAKQRLSPPCMYSLSD